MGKCSHACRERRARCFVPANPSVAPAASDSRRRGTSCGPRVMFTALDAPNNETDETARDNSFSCFGFLHHGVLLTCSIMAVVRLLLWNRVPTMCGSWPRYRPRRRRIPFPAHVLQRRAALAATDGPERVTLGLHAGPFPPHSLQSSRCCWPAGRPARRYDDCHCLARRCRSVPLEDGFPHIIPGILRSFTCSPC